MDLPKTFDEFVDARKQGFIRAKEFKDNGGKLAGCRSPLHTWLMTYFLPVPLKHG